MTTQSETDIAPTLLAWYDRHARRLPWRALPGETSDPYRVWLSEIMLQQTTVATVGAYFKRFTERWPNVEALAAAELDDVLTEWAGLGYYARARNLHKCARAVAEIHGGRFPNTEEALRDLPGIGQYTAAAVAAIAFDRPAAVMDGNIERVTTRLNAIETPLPDSKPALRTRVAAMTPTHRPGDFAQAMMDLGATVCVPGRPKCLMCPLIDFCAGRDIADTLPRKKPKKAKPTRRGAAFWIEDDVGRVLLRRRPESGLLGGMMEVPSTEWTEDGPDSKAGPTGFSLNAAMDRGAAAGSIRHTFTHFHLELRVYRLSAGDLTAPEDCIWCAPDGLGDVALPTVMRKVAKAALSSEERAE